MTDAAPPLNPYAVTEANQPPLSPADERNFSILTHVIAIFAGFISALVFYLLYKDRGPFVRAHTVTEWNFQLTLLLITGVGFLLSFGSVFVGFATAASDGNAPPSIGLFFVGYILILIVDIVRIVLGIIAAVAASRGQFYRYGIAIRFVKE
jgi:uncharacterized Tic20 family protein